MFVWILVLYLYGLAANPRTIAAPKALIALLAARWGLLRSAATCAPVSGRERESKSRPCVSPAAARGRSARNP